MPYGDRTIWIGHDDRETVPYAVARASIRGWTSTYVPVHGVVLQDLIDYGWYKRPIESRRSEHGGEVLWDVISEAPMSTQFAISRFFILGLYAHHFPNNREGWALFTDCDVFARQPLDYLFDFAAQQSDKALLCVPHVHTVVEGEVKKAGQVQSNYARKNWSSVMMLNRGHPANNNLTLDLLNTAPGRDLHRFCWLEDSDIGFLEPKWNHLVGVSEKTDPAIVHFTNGGPWLPQYSNVEYAAEWREAYRHWVR